MASSQAGRRLPLSELGMLQGERSRTGAAVVGWPCDAQENRAGCQCRLTSHANGRGLMKPPHRHLTSILSLTTCRARPARRAAQMKRGKRSRVAGCQVCAFGQVGHPNACD